MRQQNQPVCEFLSSNGFTPTELELVQSWWQTTKADTESLAETMTRIGIFRPAAERTLDLIRKGFVQGVNHTAIFHADGVDRLRNEIRPKLHLASHSTQPAAIRTQFIDPPESKNGNGPAFPKVGDTLGRCLLTGVLGQGGFGTVFSALHTTLNMPVAVKVLCNKERLPENIRTLMRREAQVLARINHNSIVRILDFDESEMPFFVMEFVEGPSLADLIRQSGSIRQERAIEMVLDVIDGLAEAWTSGIVHRDIKPGNILVTKTGQAKLADLGLAQVPGLDDTALSADPNKPIGTCAYIAPEQIRNTGIVDFRADIYALGCTLYHAVTGQIPFSGKSQREVIMKHLTAEPILPYTVAPDRVSPQASLVILKMLRKDPEERYQSYAELGEALRALLVKADTKTSHDVLVTMPELPTEPVTPPSKRSRIKSWFGRTKANAG